ncbi:substrate-binding domain-containing protein [Arthrobacter glacialis]|uniref:substrate-binding domain-containing protein n=1 Tax=Arthrobacter glacialis TaxID=1664 RepID=UPI000CD42E1A|nr:substrate-binding domain-containing protein [Arthrobacter glacialis]POH58448.1 hypothetical protein CVS28_11715 [Arthrobacter glacialis]
MPSQSRTNDRLGESIGRFDLRPISFRREISVNRQWSGQLKVAVALCCVALLGACSSPPPADPIRGALIIVGSGTQQSAINVWRDSWVKENRGVSTNFSPDGQDVGLQALVSGNTYVATSDTPLDETNKAASIGSCGPDGAFAVPTTISPVGVAYNLSGVRGLKLDASTLSAIFNGAVVSWNDPKIQALNPAVELPSAPIVPVTSKASSSLSLAGSTYFSRNAPASWTAKPSSRWPDTVAGTRLELDKDIPNEVDDNFGTIAFLNLADIGNRFNTAALKFNADFVAPSNDQIDAAIGSSQVTLNSRGVAIDLGSSEGTGYQLGSVRYQVFCSQYKHEAIATLVRSWASYVVSEPGQTKVWIALGSYAPSQKALQAAQDLVANIDYSR